MTMHGYNELGEGDYCAVYSSIEAFDVASEASDSEVRRTQRILEEVAKNGRKDLNEQMFKLEGRFPSGSIKLGEVAVYTTKVNALRIYCGFLTIKGRRLLCVEAAIKKQNKADQAQLKRVAKKLGKQFDEYG